MRLLRLHGSAVNGLAMTFFIFFLQLAQCLFIIVRLLRLPTLSGWSRNDKLLHHLIRSHYPAGHSTGGSHGRISQIDFRFSAAHTTDKIAVGGGNAALPFRQNAHMTAQAWSAGGRAKGRPSLDEGLDKTFG